MADRKISDLTALTTPASGDYLPIVDISEASAANKNKRITIEELLRGAPDGTAGAPGIGFESDPNTGIYSPGADQLALSTNGTGRLFIDASGNVNIDSNTFYVDAVNNRVAIGINNPLQLLHLSSNNPPITQITYQGVGAAQTGVVAGGAYTIGVDGGNGSTERLRITSAGLVGVGTSEPNGLKLGFGLSTSQKNGIDYVISSPYSYTDIWGAGLIGGWAGQIRFWTSNNATPSTPSMTLDESGRLGIGTTSPSNTFHVSSSSGTPALIASSTFFNVLKFTSSTNTAGCSFGIDGSSNATVENSDATKDITFVAGGSERARIDSSGRLLVGTSSSRSIAGVQWNQQTEGTSYTGASFVTNANSGIGSYVVLGKSRGTSVGSNTIVQNGDTIGVVSFAAADGTDVATEAANIAAFVDGTPGANDMPGRLVFSTTADGASSPTERMRITNAGLHYFMADGNDTTRIQNTAAAGTGTSFLAAYHSSAAGTVNTGTLSLNITTNGNITNTNNSYGAISDIKLKENIVDANSQWDDLKALQVRKYNFKEGQTHTQIGLIAQEVELVSPGLVSESPDRDEDGNDLGTVTKSVNYSVLYMKAVKALQEAMERIETLEAKVAALEGA